MPQFTRSENPGAHLPQAKSSCVTLIGHTNPKVSKNCNIHKAHALFFLRSGRRHRHAHWARQAQKHSKHINKSPVYSEELRKEEAPYSYSTCKNREEKAFHIGLLKKTKYAQTETREIMTSTYKTHFKVTIYVRT